MSKRRGNSEGSITRRKSDNRWQARVMVDGKRRYFYASTRAGVQDKLRAALRAVDDGLPSTSDRQKLGTFLTRWLEEVARPSVRASTYARYRELLHLHVIPLLGHVPLAKLSPQDLTALDAKLAGCLAPRTVGHVHRVLHRALRDATNWNLTARNVCDLVKVPQVPHHEMQVLDAEQARILLDTGEGDELEALYVLAIQTGARQGELLALRWADLNLDDGKLTVMRSVKFLAGQGAVVSAPKTDAGRRSVQLTPSAVAALRRHKTRQAEQRLRAVFWDDLDLVFCTAIGTHIQANNLLRRSWRPLLQRAGLPAVRFHDLRHSCASFMLAEGVPVKVVAEMLGHKDASVTLKVYAHVSETMQADAAAKMEALFTRAI